MGDLADPPAASDDRTTPAAAPPSSPSPAKRSYDGPLLGFLTFLVAAGAAVATSVVVAVIAATAAAILDRIRERQALIEAASGFWAMLFTILASQVVMLVVALVAWRFTGAPFRERLALRNPRVGVLGGAIVVAGGVLPLLVGVLCAAAVADRLPTFGDSEAISRIWTEPSLPLAVLWTAVIGLFPGVIEELLFRGVIQRAFLLRWPALWSILLTSVFFGLLHVAPPAVVFATILGVWLGVVAWRTESIVLPMLTHIVINSGFNAVMMVLHRHEFDERTIEIGFWALLGASFAVFVVAMRILVLRGRIAPASTPAA
ncbi:MAG: CPBP family intramembrane metalloprotease [Phycisphaerae bacterium]|nr:CPBP family intramembrane metalloprotease [Phycisphaerae bacterium]